MADRGSTYLSTYLEVHRLGDFVSVPSQNIRKRRLGASLLNNGNSLAPDIKEVMYDKESEITRIV